MGPRRDLLALRLALETGRVHAVEYRPAAMGSEDRIYELSPETGMDELQRFLLDADKELSG